MNTLELGAFLLIQEGLVCKILHNHKIFIALLSMISMPTKVKQHSMTTPNVGQQISLMMKTIHMYSQTSLMRVKPPLMKLQTLLSLRNEHEKTNI